MQGRIHLTPTTYLSLSHFLDTFLIHLYPTVFNCQQQWGKKKNKQKLFFFLRALTSFPPCVLPFTGYP